MSADWPVTLPQSFKVDTYTPGVSDNKMSSPVDQGPTKARRRSVLASRIDRGSMDVNASQWETLSAFYETTLKSGVLQFTMFDHFGGPDREVRFAAPPAPNGNGGGKFIVTLDLEILP